MILQFCLLQLLLIYLSSTNSQVVVCYFGSWATYRPGNGQFNVENIDSTLCTNIIYAFVGLDATSNTIKLLDPFNDLYDNGGKGAISRFTNLKKTNPNLKTTVAIGGFNEGTYKYSQMAASASARAAFVQSAVNFLTTYSFDGLDIDWEFPYQADAQNFVSLLKELKAAFTPRGFLLTAAVSAGKYTIDSAYDVPNINKYIDYYHIMAYDYHGSWEATTGSNAPLYSSPVEAGTENAYYNLNYTTNYWISRGASKEKLVLGMPLYGHTYTLANANNFGVYAPSTGPGNQGPYTQESGMLGYNEICEKFKTQNWNVQVEPNQRVPYGHNGNQWLTFDDPTSINLKAQYIKSMGLAGGMVWSIETDDFRGICGSKYPLLNTINSALKGDAGTTTTTVAPVTTTTTAAPTTTTTTTTAAPTTTTTKSTTTKSTTTKATTTTTTAAATTTTTAATTASTAATTTTTAAPGGSAEDPIITECKSGAAYVKDPTDATKFYQCIDKGNGNYGYYAFTCPDGLVFDVSSSSCTWAK